MERRFFFSAAHCVFVHNWRGGFRYRYNNGNGKLVCAGGGLKLGARKEKSLGKHVNGVGLGGRTQTIREVAQDDGVDADIEVKCSPGFSNASRGNHKENQGTPGDEGG